MPGRKGVLAPQNSFLDTIATRFDGTSSCFLLGSAQVPGLYPIIYCSDGFCELTGHGRAQVMQKSCTCDFLYGKETEEEEQDAIVRALFSQLRFQNVIILYRKDGSKYNCLLDIVPIKDQKSEVVMFLVSLKDITKTNHEVDEAKPFLHYEDKHYKFSDSSITSDSNGVSCMMGPRRRSRAVLYNLSGHIKDQAKSSRMSNCSSISTILQVGVHKPLEYKSAQHKRNRRTILHHAFIKNIWDWLIVLLTLYVAAVVPYYAALQTLASTRLQNYTMNEIHQHTHYPTYYFDMFLEMIFIVDIFFSFRTTFVNKMGLIVSDSKEIASHYLKSMFLIDLIAAIPFDFIGHVFEINWSLALIPVQLLKMVRLLRVLKLFKKMDHWSQYRAIVVFLLMFMFAMVAHWMACVWFSIGWTEYGRSPTGATDGTGWIYELGRALHLPFYPNKTGGPEISSAYLTSLYFTLSSLTSVGFGNVSANTNTEKMFSICVMVVGAIMHAVVFGSITAIIQRMYKKRSDFDTKERNLKDFIKANRMPKHLKKKLMENFHAKWIMNKGVDPRKVMEYFPANIQADITIHLHRDLLELPVFRKTSEGCRRFVSIHVKRRHASPNEFFIFSGEPLDQVFLVCSGSLEVLRNDIVIAILSKGDLFGADTSNDVMVTSHADVKALNFCELQCVSLEGLKKLAVLYPEHQDILHDMKADFSCQLWENYVVDAEESQRRRSDKIEEWNKHYNDYDTDEEESEGSYTYIPAITVHNDSLESDFSIPTPHKKTLDTTQMTIDRAVEAIRSLSAEICNIPYPEPSETPLKLDDSIKSTSECVIEIGDSLSREHKPGKGLDENSDPADDKRKTRLDRAHTVDFEVAFPTGITKSMRRTLSDSDQLWCNANKRSCLRKEDTSDSFERTNRRVIFEDELFVSHTTNEKQHKKSICRGGSNGVIRSNGIRRTGSRHESPISDSVCIGTSQRYNITGEIAFTGSSETMQNIPSCTVKNAPDPPESSYLSEEMQGQGKSQGLVQKYLVEDTFKQSTQFDVASRHGSVPMETAQNYSKKGVFKRQTNFMIDNQQNINVLAVAKIRTEHKEKADIFRKVPNPLTVRTESNGTEANEDKKETSGKSKRENRHDVVYKNNSVPQQLPTLNMQLEMTEPVLNRRNSRRRRRKKAESNRRLLMYSTSSSDEKRHPYHGRKYIQERECDEIDRSGESSQAGSQEIGGQLIPTQTGNTHQPQMTSPPRMDKNHVDNMSNLENNHLRLPSFPILVDGRRCISEQYFPEESMQDWKHLSAGNSCPSVLLPHNSQVQNHTQSTREFFNEGKTENCKGWTIQKYSSSRDLHNMKKLHDGKPWQTVSDSAEMSERNPKNNQSQILPEKTRVCRSTLNLQLTQIPKLNSSDAALPLAQDLSYYTTPPGRMIPKPNIRVEGNPNNDPQKSFQHMPCRMPHNYQQFANRGIQQHATGQHEYSFPTKSALSSQQLQHDPCGPRMGSLPQPYYPNCSESTRNAWNSLPYTRQASAFSPLHQVYTPVSNAVPTTQSIPLLTISTCDGTNVVTTLEQGTGCNPSSIKPQDASTNFLKIPSRSSANNFESGYSTCSPSYELNRA